MLRFVKQNHVKVVFSGLCLTAAAVLYGSVFIAWCAGWTLAIGFCMWGERHKR